MPRAKRLPTGAAFGPACSCSTEGQTSASGHLILQTIGFTDNETAVLSIVFSLGLAVGMVAGGILGDAFAKHFSRYGRPSVNQCSIAVTAPLVALFYKGLPGQPLRISGASTLAATAASAALCVLKSATLVTWAMLRSNCCFLKALAGYMSAVTPG